MKPAIQKRTAGSVLVVTVVISALVGSVLCSYLAMISARNKAAMRALAWNSAIPVLEAGIEEALTHLHEDQFNPTANNWNIDRLNGRKIFWKTRNFPDGSFYCVTNMNVATTTPLIYSAGYIPSPLRTNVYISRLVQITTTNPPSPFNMAIAASGFVKLSGSATVDGYSSLAGAYGGTNRNASGGIATDSQQAKAIDVGSAHLYGMAVTGPGGTVSVNGGLIGDLDWTSGIEPYWTNDDMNVTFQTNSPPVGRTTTPSPTTVGVSNITYLSYDTSSYIYKTDSFVSSSTNRPMIVTGHATLWVTGDFIVNGTGYVLIQPGASLNLYVGGRASISGGGVVNSNGVPSSFSYYGLSSSTNLIYSGQSDFVGTINAPEANVMLSGGSSVYGAVICNTFTSSGGSGVHYDQALAGGGMFIVTSWREMSP